MKGDKIIGDSDFRRVLSSSSIVGTGIRNSKGEDLGDVKDIMIDLQSGNISYLVVAFGGFLGMGDKYFAIPWDAFKVDERSEKLLLDVDKDKLENAPGFDKDNWPSQPQREFLERVHSHYGHKPYWDRDRDFYNVGSTGTSYSGTTGSSDYNTGRPAGSSF